MRWMPRSDTSGRLKGYKMCSVVEVGRRNFMFQLLLMVQKSGEKTTWDVFEIL